MRPSHKQAGDIIAALDLGSSKIAVMIGRIVDNQGAIEIIGAGHQASRGMKDGKIVDLQAAEDSMKQTIHTAELMAAEAMNGFPLRDIIINIPSSYTKSRITKVDMELMGHELMEQDINKALIEAQRGELEDGYEIVHAIPIGTRIDSHDGIENPEGMSGQQMQLDVNIVKAEKAALKNLVTCAERSHLDIEAFCVAPYAAGLSALTQDELQMGTTVIDMGAGITSFAVFYNGRMMCTGSIPWGGAHVTSDIAQGLNTSIQNAERIKILYGGALASVSDQSDMIDVPTLGGEDDNETELVQRATLISIVQPRLEEIFEMIRTEIQSTGLPTEMLGRIVLTGGASQTPGMRDLAQMILNAPVRIGRPSNLSGLPESMSSAAFAVTTGLLNYAATRLDERPRYQNLAGEAGGFFRGILQWLKENW